MKVIEVFDEASAVVSLGVLRSAGAAVHGGCPIALSSYTGFQLLVDEPQAAVSLLEGRGVRAVWVEPPQPLDPDSILWWKQWRQAVSGETYLALRLQHHEELRSEGSLIRIPRKDFPSPEAEPWSILADAGQDVRCEFHCNLPTGPEVHLLVPDAELATKTLQSAGFKVTDVDYAGPDVKPGISWWGRWEPALAYAKETGRPILMSFASPRVEQVPGVW